MPDCGHKGAVCVVGNFWTCKVRGCVNGPKDEPKKQALQEEWPQLSFEWDEDFKTPVTSSCTGFRDRFGTDSPCYPSAVFLDTCIACGGRMK